MELLEHETPYAAAEPILQWNMTYTHHLIASAKASSFCCIEILISCWKNSGEKAATPTPSPPSSYRAGWLLHPGLIPGFLDLLFTDVAFIINSLPDSWSTERPVTLKLGIREDSTNLSKLPRTTWSAQFSPKCALLPTTTGMAVPWASFHFTLPSND